MSCPNCNSLEYISISFSRKYGLSESFVDKNNRTHYHDGNSEHHARKCNACGHHFYETIQQKCWCGWPPIGVSNSSTHQHDLAFYPKN